MVGTTRFELATSPTAILETTKFEQLGEIYQYVRERETTDATLIGPVMDPQLDPSWRTRLTQRGTNGNGNQQGSALSTTAS
jgi:hypothetical protein